TATVTGSVTTGGAAGGTRNARRLRTWWTVPATASPAPTRTAARAAGRARRARPPRARQDRGITARVDRTRPGARPAPHRPAPATDRRTPMSRPTAALLHRAV